MAVAACLRDVCHRLPDLRFQVYVARLSRCYHLRRAGVRCAPWNEGFLQNCSARRLRDSFFFCPRFFFTFYNTIASVYSDMLPAAGRA
jgi:hypothetical protein